MTAVGKLEPGSPQGRFAASEAFKVVIIGAGISGLTNGIELVKRFGSSVDFLIVERDEEAGGVWYTAQWPGAAVDSYVHAYAHYLEPSDWKGRYASREDIFQYWQKLIEKYHLRPRIAFHTTFVGSRWDEAKQQHLITLQPKDGSTYKLTANVLICGSGPLSTPRIPDLPGLDRFKGNYFHNLQWNRSLDLSGKTIGIVGNGSSAVQFTPELAKLPGTKVVQFIRSGGFFRPKIDTPYSQAVRWAFLNIPGTQWFYRSIIFLLTHDARWSSSAKQVKQRLALESQLTAYLKTTAPEQYHDILKPEFPFGCKRPPMDAGWLESLHRPNVLLTSSKIKSVYETGLETEDGKRYDLDVIIFATGAKVATTGCGASKNIFGIDGKEVEEFWKERGGPEAYLGLAIPTHPNFFWTIGPNSTSGAWSYTSAVCASTIARLLKTVLDENLTSVAPTWAAFEAHNAVVRSRLPNYTVTSNLCTSWYKTESGKSTMLNPYSGIGYWWKLRTMSWSDWSAQARDGDKLVTIDLHSRFLKRRILKVLAVTTLAVLGTVFKKPVQDFVRALLKL